MLGKGLKKYAAQLGLTIDQGVAFGEVHGYLITLSDAANQKLLGINVIFVDDTQKNNALSLFIQDDICKQYRIQNVNYSGGCINISFFDNPGCIKRLQGFIEMYLPVLEYQGVLGAGNCNYCGQEISGESSVRLINGVAVKLHGSCASKLDLDVRVIKDNEALEKKNYGRGALGAFLGSIAGSVPWAAAYYFGWFVGWLGFLIGIAAEKGYSLLGGKSGKAKTWIILGFSLFGVIIAQIAGDMISLIPLVANGEVYFTYGEIPSFIWLLLSTDSEYRISFIGNIVLGFIFALLGTFTLLKNIHSQGKGIQIKKLR